MRSAPNSASSSSALMEAQSSSSGGRDGGAFLKGLLAGGAAGSLSKTVVAPLDRVKLVLQLQDARLAVLNRSRYRGITDCFVRISADQGLLSFWRGNYANILRSFPQSALNFAVRDKYRLLFLHGVDKQRDFWRFAFGNVLAGGSAAATCLLFLYPLDFARTRLAADLGSGVSREFKGPLQCIVAVFKSDGVGGLYRGFSASVQYVFISRAAFFGLFDTIRCQLLVRDGSLPTFTSNWSLAQACLMLAGLTTYPLDTVRRRLMMQSGPQQCPVAIYRGALHCWRSIAQKEGARAFYKGAWSNTLRGTGSALVLAFYYEIIKYT